MRVSDLLAMSASARRDCHLVSREPQFYSPFHHRMNFAHDHNRRAWDAMARRQARFTRPAGDDDYSSPLSRVDGMGWLGDVRNKKLLCLAAGGGRQGPMYAAAGADVTIVDISQEMLDLDRQVATEKGLKLRTIQASMDDLSMFASGEFQIVIQPVSTCYVPKLRPVYDQVARICGGGAIYVSQHKQPASLQADAAPSPRGYELIEPYFRSGPLPAVTGSLHREEGTMEFVHRWDELLGDLCRAGFAITDVMEPHHADATAAPGTFAHRSQYVPPYIRIRSVRNDEAGPPAVVLPT